MERLHSGLIPYLFFLLFSLLLRWPGKAALNLLRGRFACVWAVMKGSLHGIFGRGLRDRSHLALPRNGRGTRDLEP